MCETVWGTKAGGCPFTDAELLSRRSARAVQLVLKLDSKYSMLSASIFKRTQNIGNLGTKLTLPWSSLEIYYLEILQRMLAKIFRVGRTHFVY